MPRGMRDVLRIRYAARVNERGFVLAQPGLSNRRNVVYWTAHGIVMLAHHLLVRPHVELDEALPEVKKGGKAVILYCGLHRSLWETTGLMPPLVQARVPLPWAAMGDNLVHGQLFQKLAKMIGCFMVERPSSRREMLQSAVKLRTDLLSFFAHGYDILLFPEGTRKNIPAHGRYGDFFPAAFDALLDYERNREQIVAYNPGLRPLATYLGPVNVDYSLVREAEEMTSEQAGTPRTLNVLDSFSMLRNIGDTWLCYGAPIRVADHLDKDRKALANLCRERCLEMVKVLPINVASRAMLQLDLSVAFQPAALHAAVARVVDSLRPHARRVRGFSADDPPAEIVRRAANRQLSFATLQEKDLPLFRLYANYIEHL
jgi:1-acyl-sn-glycerol-3-phosphate acyltransferase